MTVAKVGARLTAAMRAFAVGLLLFPIVLELSVRTIGALAPYPPWLRALNDVVTL